MGRCSRDALENERQWRFRSGKSLFGADGKANLINCDPGRSCGDVVDFQLDTFGLKDTVRSVRGRYEALMVEAVARVKRGEMILPASHKQTSWHAFGCSAIWFCACPLRQRLISTAEATLSTGMPTAASAAHVVYLQWWIWMLYCGTLQARAVDIEFATF